MVVHNLFIILCLDYLKAVADFFLQTQNQFSEQLKAAHAAAAITREAGGISSRRRTAIVRAPEPKPTVAKKTGVQINVLFTMDNPEIILVEDSMNPNTNALMLEVKI